MVTSPKPARRIPRRARRTAAVITASLLASGFSMANAIAETPQPGNDATEVTDNVPHQTADNISESKQATTDAATDQPDNHAGMTSTSTPTSNHLLVGRNLMRNKRKQQVPEGQKNPLHLKRQTRQSRIHPQNVYPTPGAPQSPKLLVVLPLIIRFTSRARIIATRRAVAPRLPSK